MDDPKNFKHQNKELVNFNRFIYKSFIKSKYNSLNKKKRNNK